MGKLKIDDHQIFKIVDKIEKGYINRIYKVVNGILYKLRKKDKKVQDVPRSLVEYLLAAARDNNANNGYQRI